MPRWRSPIRLRLLVALGLVAGLAAAHIFGVSALQAWNSPYYEARDLYVPRLIDVVIVMWCFWVGSSVGSFLNVVAWRMPRNESINGRSHCPRCRAQLKARDNFPVFGWLALGGRCRSCRLPISARYPIVEACVGATIALVAVCELYRLCLPYQRLHWHGGPLWAPVVDRTSLITMLYHVVGLAVCWAMGLIRLDGHRLPGRLLVFGIAATVIPMIALPFLMVVPWQLLHAGLPESLLQSWSNPSSLHLHAIARVITSVVAAIFLARVLARGLCPTADPKLDPLGSSTARLIDLIALLAVPITLIGWQAAPAVVVFASIIAYSLQSWLPKSCDALGRFAISLPIALTFQIVFWRAPLLFWFLPREDRASSLWPSEVGPPWVILAWGAVVLFVPLWLREDFPLVPRKPDFAVDPDEAESAEHKAESDQALIAEDRDHDEPPEAIEPASNDKDPAE